MPDITFGAGVNSSPAILLEAFSNIGMVPLINFSPTQLTFSLGAGNLTYFVTGTGINVSGGTITAGTITGIEVRNFGVTQATMTGLSLSAVDLQVAIVTDNSGANISAVEDMFLPLGYNYIGNGNDDTLLFGAVSSDGIALNFSGNDKFDTGGGRDNIWLGGGNDTGVGGAGNDTFRGDAGNDSLLGGTGGDRLFGDADNDTLAGGSGTDRLDGGAGKDRVVGGEGNDTMAGGSGKDTFVFAYHSGVDQITDFSLADDAIDLPTGAIISFISAAGGTDTVIDFGTFGDQILLSGVAFADAALIHII